MTWDFLSLLSSWTMSKKQRFTFNRSNEIFKKKTSKFEWTLNDIRIEKTISAPIWATKLFLKVSPLLDVRHCPKLQSCPISRKTYDATLRKWQTFFMVLPLLVVRQCSKLSSYSVSRKTYQPNLKRWPTKNWFWARFCRLCLY